MWLLNIICLEMNPELIIICFFFRPQPISEEFQNGEGFGYIVAFRANGTRGWKEKMVTSADSTTYKYRDETFPPLTPFEVRVGVYNNKGDGPFSEVVTVFSAEGGEGQMCSCSDWWDLLLAYITLITHGSTI